MSRKVRRPYVRSKGPPREVSLAVLKQNLVAEVIGKPGGFGEAVKEVRSYWRIDAPPVQRLPAPDEDLLLPPVLSSPSDPSDLLAAWSHHPDLPAGPPEDEHAVVRDLKWQWRRDLSHALLLGGVPERYLEKPSSHVGYPLTSTRILPWLRFAAACVLCDVPVRDAPKLAEVGGVPSLRRNRKEESVVGVIGPREQRDRYIAAEEKEARRKLLQDKLWELRSELPDDRGSAEHEVWQRYGEELRREGGRARAEAELWLKLNPLRKYLIEFDPQYDKPADIKWTVDAALAECGVDPQAHGRPAQGDLLCVMIARLLNEPGCTVDQVAAELGLSRSTVTTYGKRGKRIVAGEL